MYQAKRRRNSVTLWLLVSLAAVYGGWLHFLHRLTGQTRVDASIGVVLGLFICSRPAANMLDLILFGRYSQQYWSRRSTALWLALNVVVMLVGLLVLTSGTTRFAAGQPR